MLLLYFRKSSEQRCSEVSCSILAFGGVIHEFKEQQQQQQQKKPSSLKKKSMWRIKQTASLSLMNMPYVKITLCPKNKNQRHVTRSKRLLNLDALDRSTSCSSSGLDLYSPAGVAVHWTSRPEGGTVTASFSRVKSPSLASCV